MKQSSIFTKVRRDAPKDEVSKSAALLIRAGFINKEMAGVYDVLPLGVRVMNKIKKIVREEMNRVGGQELEMTALQDPAIWKKTDRWDDDKVDNWFKTALKNDSALGLGFTHEEPITKMMTQHVNSYKDLPVMVYQFQTKFRNELRAKSGIMRGREFLMKDLYSFALNQEQHDEMYEKVKKAYVTVFEKVGLGERTYVTFASGGSFSKFSHEFQTVTDAGEDLIYLDESKNIAVNKEVLTDEVLADLKIDRANLKELKTVEVGNIFGLGTKFSAPLELIVDDGKGARTPVIMGSYGIGIGRLMGTVAEVFADDKGLVWPESIAPFKYHLVNLLADNKDTDELYDQMMGLGFDVLYDNRDVRAGEKLAESDLIGIPYRIIFGKKFAETGKVELVERKTGNALLVPIADLIKSLE
jgi:prolyl-tRNA synthetase